MARLSVDDSSRRDPRIVKLARVMGEHIFAARGRLQEVWWLCYDRRSAVVSCEDADIVAEVEGYSQHLVACRLAEVVDPLHIRVKGADERIAYLIAQQEKGRKSAEARANKQPQLSAGSTPAQPRLNSGSNPAQPTSSSSSSSSSSSGEERERESTEPAAPILTPPKPLKAQRLKRAETTLPSDWKPTDAHREKARELGVNVEREADRFRDNALAKGRLYVDWNAAFRTWLGNALEFSRSNGTNRAAAQPASPAIEPPRRLL